MKKMLVRVVRIVMVSGLLLAAGAMAATLPDFSDLIEKASPAVVKIIAVSTPHQARPMGQMRQLPNNQQQDIPDIFRELLEQRQIQRPDRGALGSGFIISNDGYILTNNHVISEADDIKVVLSDRREFVAKLIGADDRSDIALLKIDAKNLPLLTLAKNEKIKVGQWVVAIGSPFGLDYSASAGIVSAIGRSIPSENHENTYVPFIQTDVAINPGNSGGPLFNMDGEVVGINSQIFSPSGGSVGLSFAIPASVALDAITQLKEKGHVDRGWLGVVIQNVDKDLANSYGLDKAQGALVVEVMPKGPADKAGIKVGDLIVQFNGQDINNEADLPHVVGRLVPNSKASLDVIRKGKRESLSVIVGKLPTNNEQAQNQSIPTGDEKPTKIDALGLSVAPVDVSEKEKGVQILNVAPESAAQRAGLMRGDIITQLDFVDIDSLESYKKIVGSMEKNMPKAIRFVRNGSPVFRSIILK